MKRMAFALVVFLIVVGFAVSGAQALGQQAKAAKGKPGGGGGNGGGGGSEPHYVLKMTINDDFHYEDFDGERVNTRLLSDGLERTVSDENEVPTVGPLGDSDGFWELIGDPDLSVDYQDYRLPFATSGTHPDPCALFDLSTDSSPGRTTLQLSRRSSEFVNNIRCDLSTDPPYADDDERTFTLVFDKGEGTAKGDIGGACACDRLSYVNDVTGARTTFMPDTPAGFCSLAIAKGEILPLGENSGPKITAWPFEDLLDSKKAQRKARQSPDDKTTVNIAFRTDVENLGDQQLWGLSSQGEIVEVLMLDDDDDTRLITSRGQLFDLNGPDQVFGGSGQCSNVTMTFQFTVKRFDLNAGK